MKKIFLSLAGVVLAAAMMTSCSGKTETTDNEAESAATVAALPDSVVVKVLDNDSLLRPDSKVERLTVIDFNAPWCGPCRMLTPSFDAVADSLHETVDFYSVNIDMMTATAKAFGIQAIPAVVVMSPADSTRTYVGLDPYLDGVDMDSIEGPEQLTRLLTPALFKVLGR